MFTELTRLGEFPGGLVVRILGFYCCGLGSASDWRTEILQAMRHGGEKKKLTRVIQNGDTQVTRVLRRIYTLLLEYKGFPGGVAVKNLPANVGGAGDLGLIPGGRKDPLE